ncbi:ABC transporter ATP-binding protein [Pseudovibrio brasiliensis]|nr:ABC transporter ATP-binding protein [Pseudovibrio brasiliensis]
MTAKIQTNTSMQADESPSQDVHIALRDIRKNYGKAVAIRDLNLNIDRGQFTAIMGPSGCGKSTLLRCLAGLESITTGDILRSGRSIRHQEIWEREMPMVWQSLALFPFLSVLENIEFGLRMSGVSKGERHRRAHEWASKLGLDEYVNRSIDQLSGGQRQRVALARCLVTEPSIILLDEPLSALDAHLSLQMQAELKRLQRELGITFVYVTHSHSEAFSMADKVVIMNEGRVEQEGAPQEIYLKPATSFVARFLGGSSILSCTVKSTETDEVLVDGKDGTFRCTSDEFRTLRVGSKINLIVRADQISLSQESGWADNEVYCRVVGEEFVGALVNLQLETASGSKIFVQLQQRDLKTLDIEVGAGVFANWHPEDCHIIN